MNDDLTAYGFTNLAEVAASSLDVVGSGTALVVSNGAAIGGALSANSLGVTAGATVGGNLSVTGTSTFTGNLSAGNITLSGKIDGTAGTVVFDNDIQVEGDVVGDLRIAGDLYLAGDVYSQDPVINFACHVTVNGNLESTGVTRTPWRKFALPDADGTIAGKDYNLLIAWAGTISSTRSYSITTTGAVDGDWFWVANRDGSTENININPTTGDVSTVQNGTAVLYVYDIALGWKLVKYFGI